MKIDLDDYETLDELSHDLPQLTWILPHMGCYFKGREMQRWCEFARSRATSTWTPPPPIATRTSTRRSSGPADKITFASDGFLFSPLVEKAKSTPAAPHPHRTPLRHR